jgi:hypothetical protein
MSLTRRFGARTATLGIVLVLIQVACGRSDKSSSTPTPPESMPTKTVAASTGAATDSTKSKSPCPHTGLWAICSVENRLKQAGFVARRVVGVAPRRAGFTVPPVVFTLGASRLEVFIYASEKDLARDVAGLDTVRVVPVGTPSTWQGNPVFIRSGNLVAVFLGENQRQSERLALALTAGAPQPGSPR